MADERLLNMLVCPWCLGGLEREGDELACRKCCAVYSIEDGIPNMLVEEAALHCTNCSAALEVKDGVAACPNCGGSWPVHERRKDLQ